MVLTVKDLEDNNVKSLQDFINFLEKEAIFGKERKEYIKT